MLTKMQFSELHENSLYDTFEKRQSLLKASKSERRTKAWRGKWKELEEPEMGLEQITKKGQGFTARQHTQGPINIAIQRYQYGKYGIGGGARVLS